MIPFAEWLPDRPDYKNEGATEALNVFPSTRSYKPINGLTVYSSALAERPLGGKSGLQSNGTTYNFIGTSTYLYNLQAAGTWDDVSVAGSYSTTSGEYWRFAQWGDQMLATNYTDNPQEYTMGTSTDFAALTTALKGRYIATTTDFVFLGNTYDATDGAVPNRVRWCAIGDPTSWTVSATTQADYTDLDADNGWVQGIVSGNDVYVFQEKAITRFRYVGSPVVFDPDVVEPERGCYVPNSIIQVGNLVYFLAEDGFYVFDGAKALPIGEGKVDKTFFADLHEIYRSRMSATIDPINKLIIWAYPSIASAGELDKLMIYNWVENKWSHSEISATFLFSSSSLGYTLDGLDALYSNIDTIPDSLDSRRWLGGANSLTAFNASFEMCYFTGSQLAGVIETSEDELNQGRKTLIRRVRPILDGTHTVQIGTRNLQTDSVTWGSALTPNTAGECFTLSNARFHRFRVNTTSGLTHAQGIDIIEAAAMGRY